MATHGIVGNNLGFSSPLSFIIYGGPTSSVVFRKNNVTKPLFEDRWFASRPFAIGKDDDLSIVLDNDVNSKRFDVNLSRRVSTSGIYSDTQSIIADYGGTMFGPSVPAIVPLTDYALVMQPRLKTNPATTSMVLWRWKRFGENNVSLKYVSPTVPQQSTSWTLDYATSNQPTLSITLPSNTQPTRFLNNLTTNARVAVANTAEASPTGIHYVWVMTGYNIASLQSNGTDTTVTISSPTGITLTGCGLTNGDVVYLTIDAGIPWIASDAYTVHSVSGMTFKVSAATGGAQGPTAGGTSVVTFDDSPDADFANLLVGDTIVFDAAMTPPSVISGVPVHVVDFPLAAGGNRAFKGAVEVGNAAAVTVPVFSDAIADLSYVQAFLAGGTIASIASDINALTSSPVSAVALGIGGQVVEPTWYSENDNSASFPFVDGINYIKSVITIPSGAGYSYHISFKNPVDMDLLGYPQWSSEEAYLCPMTAVNVCNYLNNLAVCGLSANGQAEPSSGGSKIQITTSTIGSVGSVQIRGGLANSALANIRGAATLTTDLLASYVVVPTTQTSGFHPGWPVKITNSGPYLRDNGLINNTLASIVGNTWTVSGGAVATMHSESNRLWQFEKQGKFFAINAADNGTGVADLSGYMAGDYVVVYNDVGDTVVSDNCGTFVIVAIDASTIWVEHTAGVEEVAFASVDLITYDSLMVGDQIVVSSDHWGATNRSTFTVSQVNYVSDAPTTVFKTVETPTAVGAPIAGPAVGVQITAYNNHTLVKTLHSIVPLPDDPTYSIMSFREDGLADNTQLVNENYGSQLSALGKFAFTVGTTIGTDGYAHSVGLIGEADKVMYGYETDPVSYPGVVAAGSNINISGPLVKRIQVGLSLRVRGTASVIFEAVRGAVATFINTSKVGESIAISDIISVASSIGGVEAVSVSSPAYSTSADRITVQPYEKALVLQPELDITLTLIG